MRFAAQSSVLILLFFLTTISLFIWSVLAFFHGGFWQVQRFNGDLQSIDAPAAWPRVLAIVPARNEAETIARIVESLLKQGYHGEYRVIIVDDHSKDSTASLALAVARSAGAAERLTIVSAETLPKEWTGKLWAMQQGVESGTKFAPDYFWFTDADIVHAPDTLQRLVSRAGKQNLDLTSLMVLLQTKSIAERLLIPPFLYFFLKLYPPQWIADIKAKTAGAAGGCVLLRQAALLRIGGLPAIRGEVIDDCALARAVKRSGGAIWMGLTRKSVSLRAYTSFGEIRDLIARTAFTQLGYSTLVLLGTLLGMLVTYVAPVAFAFSTQPILWRMGLAAWALMTITYLPTVRFYGLSPLWAPALPLAAAFYSYATWVSAVRYWLGKGGQWKGRAQAPSS
ncbi:MAG TPA: glycosyltransferase [Candidatus Acidoferrum sp.]